MNDKKEILVVGAGRLGKGYIGEEFEKAGWQVTFLGSIISSVGKQESFSCSQC